MTYLQMVNNVLKRLREREVSSVNSTAYSSLIGILINDAKNEVEDAWDWSALRTTITTTTSADTFSYVLTGTQNKAKLLDVYNDTDNFEMYYKEPSWLNQQFLLTTPQKESPIFYSFNGVDNDGDTVVDVYPIPNGVYTLRFNAVVRQADLSADTDVLTIPAHPVLMLAYAKAVEERGEDGGASSSNAYLTAGRAINDAISMDSIKHPEELIWQVV